MTAPAPIAPAPDAEKLRCRKCGTVNLTSLARCTKCAHDLEWSCRRCGRTTSKAIDRCFCGARRGHHLPRAERQRRRIRLAAYLAAAIVLGAIAGHYIGLSSAMAEVGRPVSPLAGLKEAFSDVSSPFVAVYDYARAFYGAHRHVTWSVAVATFIALTIYAWQFPPRWLRRALGTRSKRRLGASTAGSATDD